MPPPPALALARAVAVIVPVRGLPRSGVTVYSNVLVPGLDGWKLRDTEQVAPTRSGRWPQSPSAIEKSLASGPANETEGLRNPGPLLVTETPPPDAMVPTVALGDSTPVRETMNEGVLRFR
jgi:hypothetical protein